MTQQDVQRVVDGLFAFLNQRLSGHPLAQDVVGIVKNEVDTIGIPALFTWLKNNGYIS